VPSKVRRFRKSVKHHVRRLRDDEDRLGAITAYHRERDILRWPTMCHRAGCATEIAGAADITAQQVLAIKRSGFWESTTLKPVFSGVRTYCREEGNPALAALSGVWKLPGRSIDRRCWLTELQLAECYAKAAGRVKVRVALQGFLGMREDSARDLRVRDLMLDGPVPRMAFAVKGQEGDRLTIPVDAEVAGIVRSWLESQGLGTTDRVYGVSHSTADADLRQLGTELGLPFPLSGHVLRRSWARITYLANPCLEQVRSIQRILGHRDISTSWHYIGADYIDMDRALASFHERMRHAALPAEA
jgi:integrase